MKASLFSILAAASLLASPSFAAAVAGPGQDDHRYAQQNPNDRHDNRNNKDFNYGYDKNHRVTAQERARWEAAHRNDNRRDDRQADNRDDRNGNDSNYGYAKNHQVTAQERARWEAAHRNNNNR